MQGDAGDIPEVLDLTDERAGGTGELGCEWCVRLHEDRDLLVVRHTFAVDVPRQTGNAVVVVPVPHVPHLTGLTSADMATVLAALSQLTRAVRRTGAEVSITAGEGPHVSVILSVEGGPMPPDVLGEVVKALFARAA